MKLISVFNIKKYALQKIIFCVHWLRDWWFGTWIWRLFQCLMCCAGQPASHPNDRVSPIDEISPLRLRHLLPLKTKVIWMCSSAISSVTWHLYFFNYTIRDPIFICLRQVFWLWRKKSEVLITTLVKSTLKFQHLFSVYQVINKIDSQIKLSSQFCLFILYF